MKEDQKEELKIWTKPEVVDVDSDASDVMSGTQTANDGFGGSSS